MISVGRHYGTGNTPVTKELSRNNFHISGGATRLPLPAKAQTGGPLRVAS